MKTNTEIADEFFKQRQLLWYVDWLLWREKHPVESLDVATITSVYNPAVLFADTIDHAYREEINTRRLLDPSEATREKLHGQCVALAWVIDQPLKELEKQCGPEEGVPMPHLPKSED